MRKYHWTWRKTEEKNAKLRVDAKPKWKRSEKIKRIKDKYENWELRIVKFYFWSSYSLAYSTQCTAQVLQLSWYSMLISNLSLGDFFLFFLFFFHSSEFIYPVANFIFISLSFRFGLRYIGGIVDCEHSALVVNETRKKKKPFAISFECYDVLNSMTSNRDGNRNWIDDLNDWNWIE